MWQWFVFFLPCLLSLDRKAKQVWVAMFFFENQSNFRPMRRPSVRPKTKKGFCLSKQKNIEERFLWPVSCHHRDAPSKKKQNKGILVFNRGARKAFVFASNTTVNPELLYFLNRTVLFFQKDVVIYYFSLTSDLHPGDSCFFIYDLGPVLSFFLALNFESIDTSRPDFIRLFETLPQSAKLLDP